MLPGDYAASCSLIGWSITPAVQNITVSGLQFGVDDFTGALLPTWNVTGLTVDEAAAGLFEVELRITRQDGAGGSVSTWSDNDGSWFIPLPDGDYLVEPHSPGWGFTPPSRQFSVAGADADVDEFTGAPLPGYLLDGYVFAADGSTPLPNIQLNISPAGEGVNYNAFTDETGYWSVLEAIDGSYTVEPFQVGWEFTPAQRNVTVAGGPAHVGSFTGSELELFTVDGYIYLADGVTPLAGIDVQLNGGSGWFFATTDSAGRYVFTDVFAGLYYAFPQSASYSFAPSEREANVESDTTFSPFLATALPAFPVDGHVYRPDGTTGIPGVQVTVYTFMPAGTSFEATTDSQGYWRIPAVPAGYYLAYPELQGFLFEPAEQELMIEDSGVTVPPFTGTELAHYTLSGEVMDKVSANQGLPGVVIQVEGMASSYEAVTDANGHWQLDTVYEDTYDITPMLSPWIFEPAGQVITISGGDAVAETFYGTSHPAWLVEGYVYEMGTTTPVPDVEVWFLGPATYRCTTDASGHYSLPLPAGSWEAWPSSGCWSFEPYLQLFDIDGTPLTLDVFYALPGG